MNQPAKFLLIDDDPDDQEIFGMVLKEVDSAIRCDFANDGVQAVDKLRSNASYAPDYILIDLNMPRMNGLDTLREIKKMGHLIHTKMYIYSTSAGAAQINQSKALGADDFIQKPTAIGALKDILLKIINSQ